MPAVEMLGPATDPFTLLVYGHTGAGKTTLAAEAQDHPDLADVVFLNIDRGLSSISHRTDIRVMNINSAEDMQQTRQHFLSPVERRPDLLKTVKTVVIDSLSALRDETLLNVTQAGVSAGRRQDRFDVQQKDWGHMTRLVATFVTDLRNVGINVILTAGVREDMSEGFVRLIPDLNPALRSTISHAVSNIWYAADRAGSYRLLTLSRDNFPVKTRNARFKDALITYTREHGPADKEDEAEGWVFLNNGANTPTLPILYDLYLNAQKGV